MGAAAKHDDGNLGRVAVALGDQPLVELYKTCQFGIEDRVALAVAVYVTHDRADECGARAPRDVDHKHHVGVIACDKTPVADAVGDVIPPLHAADDAGRRVAEIHAGRPGILASADRDGPGAVADHAAVDNAAVAAAGLDPAVGHHLPDGIRAGTEPTDRVGSPLVHIRRRRIVRSRDGRGLAGVLDAVVIEVDVDRDPGHARLGERGRGGRATLRVAEGGQEFVRGPEDRRLCVDDLEFGQRCPVAGTEGA